MQRATTSRRRRRRSPSVPTLIARVRRDLLRTAASFTALAAALEPAQLDPPLRDALGHLITRAFTQTHLWLTLASVGTLA